MLDQQVDDARRALVQKILAASPPRLAAVGYGADAPAWAKSADGFAGKLSHALQVPPISDLGAACAWYREAIGETRQAAMSAKLERDRLMYVMLGGEAMALQPRPVLPKIADITSAAGAGRIEQYLLEQQIEAVGLWRIWLRERDSLNAIRDQAAALDRHGDEAWERVSGRPFPGLYARERVAEAIRRRWQ